MNAQEQMEIEWRCTRLIHEFAHCMDSRNYEQLASLFTPDGVFDRVGAVLKGREQILETLRKRSLELRTRHFCVNILFSEVTATRARAKIYCVNFVGKGDPPGEAVTHAMAQGAVLEFRDVFEHTAEGWKIAERIAASVMMPTDAPHH